MRHSKPCRMLNVRSISLCLTLSSLALGCAGTKPAWELPPPPVHANAIVAEGALIKLTLPNGLRVMLLADHSRPMVSMGLAVRRGAAIEPVEKAGVGALCTEVMQRGAGDRDALAMADAADALGASVGVNINFDSVRISTSGLARDGDTLLEFVRDMARKPRFDEAEIEKARSEQLAGLSSSLDNPKTLLGWQLERTLYGEHRYGTPVSGLPGTVAAITPDDVRDFHSLIFQPNNAVFYASGDFDSDALIAKLEVAFGDWHPGPVPQSVAAPPAQVPVERKIVVLDRPEMSQVQIAVAHEGLRRIDPRRIPASLLNNVLGGSGFSSRLMVQLRSNAGLTYSVRSSFALRRRAGRFGVTTFTRAKQMRPAIELLLSEIEAIRGPRPPDALELRNAKAFSVGHFALGLETSQSVMASLVNLDVYGLPEDSLDSYRARIGAVTQPEVAALAKDLLHPDRAAIVIVGPAEALLPELATFGSVEVVEW